MPNDLTLNPIFIDTAMVAAAAPARPIWVKKVLWFNPTTIGHVFTIHDGTSATNTLLEGRAEVANQSQNFDFDPPQLWSDFQVTPIDSGVIYIYF